MVQLSFSCMTTGKTITLTRQNAGKIMPLLFNMLSSLVIAFLPRSKCLLISWLLSTSQLFCSNNFAAQRNKFCHCFHCFPIILPLNDGTGCHDLSFLNVECLLNVKPAFSLSSFTFIKRLFSSSSLSAVKVVSSACLRLLIFPLAVLIQLVFYPAWNFSCCTLHVNS